MPDKTIKVVNYDVKSALWSASSIRIAVLSDIHACGRWMPLERVSKIVTQVNELRPDLIVMPGDFLVGHLIGKQPIKADEIATVLAGLNAPMGVFASLGNHDWADCQFAQGNGYQESSIEVAFENAGIRVLKNEACFLPGGAYLVGLDSAIGHGSTRNPKPRIDDECAF